MERIKCGRMFLKEDIKSFYFLCHSPFWLFPLVSNYPSNTPQVQTATVRRARAPPKILPCTAGRLAPHSLRRFCSQEQKTKALNLFFAYVCSDDAKTSSFLSPAFRPGRTCGEEKKSERKKVFFAELRGGGAGSSAPDLYCAASCATRTSSILLARAPNESP